MKKVLCLVIVTAAAFGLVPAHATQSVSGTIIAPSGTLPSVGPILAGGPLTRQERCAFLAGGHQTDGLVGWAVDLSAAEGNGTTAYSLSSSDDQAYVAFYSALGTCDSRLGAPVVTGSAPAPAASINGIIPLHSTIALIVVFGNPNGNFSFSVS